MKKYKVTLDLNSLSYEVEAEDVDEAVKRFFDYICVEYPASLGFIAEIKPKEEATEHNTFYISVVDELRKRGIFLSGASNI